MVLFTHLAFLIVEGAVKGKLIIWVVRRFNGTCIRMLRVSLIARDIWEQKKKD